MNGMLGWALPLACTVLSYGLAGALAGQTTTTTGQFCVLLVIAKTGLNWLAWAVFSRAKPTLNAFMRWTLLGQVVNGLAWICYFQALAPGNPAAIVQTVTAAYTAFAALLAMIFLKERLVAIQLVGISLVVTAGMILGYTGGGTATEAGQGHWFLFSLGTLACWAVAVVIFKHAYNQEGASDPLFFLGNWLGMAITLLPFGMVWGTAGDPISGMAWLVVFLYAIGDLTLFAAIARGPAAIVSPLSGLYPLPTIAYAALVLHQPILSLQWVAILMVLVAIVLVVPEADNPLLKLIRKS